MYYAGHGLQMQGTNYFLPVDATVQRERDLAYDAISLDMILREAEAARDLRIVILDACRDNPFAARIARAGGATRALQITEGLAQAGNVGRDTLVAYATAANALADDGSDRHSPYTTALLKHLETPGLEINLLFGRVRDSVFEATAGRQTPFTYGSLGGDPFYLIPPKAAAPVVAAPGYRSGAGGAVLAGAGEQYRSRRYAAVPEVLSGRAACRLGAAPAARAGRGRQAGGGRVAACSAAAPAPEAGGGVTASTVSTSHRLLQPYPLKAMSL